MSNTGRKISRDDGSKARTNEQKAAGRVKEKLSAERVQSSLGSSGPEMPKTMRQKASYNRPPMTGPGRYRRLGAVNDVHSDTSVLTTAKTFAGTRRATRAPTTACGTCIALNARHQRPFGCKRQTEKATYNPWRNDLSANAGADVDGSLEGIAEDTARSVPEWSGPAAAGWGMLWEGATCAVDFPQRCQSWTKMVTSTRSGSGARNA